MERATLMTTRLADELRAVGITPADMPAAIRTVLKIVKDEGTEDGLLQPTA